MFHSISWNFFAISLKSLIQNIILKTDSFRYKVFSTYKGSIIKVVVILNNTDRSYGFKRQDVTNAFFFNENTSGTEILLTAEKNWSGKMGKRKIFSEKNFEDGDERKKRSRIRTTNLDRPIWNPFQHAAPVRVHMSIF